MLKKLKFLFLIIILMPFMVKAYGIENYYIDATIENNGDILIQEYFNLTGSFNGFERIIEYNNPNLYEFDPNMNSFGGSLIHNGDGIEILEIKAVSINSNFSFDNIEGDLFKSTHSASKGDYGVYEISSNTNGYSILIYNPSKYNKAFYMKYRIKNIAIKHNDIGEIGWNVIGNKLSEPVGNLKINLHIPNNTNIKAWAHGPLNGNVEIINSETVLFTVSNLSSYKAVDIRATFDLNVINKSTKSTNVDALNKIIIYETDKAEQANYERQNKEKIKEQDALYYLSKFEVHIDRYYYNLALKYINRLSDLNVKNEYLKRLETSKILLDIEEKETALSNLKFANRNPEYINYRNAKESIEIIDNEETRNELLQELLVVEKKIKEYESEREIKNYIGGIILIIVISIISYIIYKKFVKDPKTEFNQKYFRDIPSDYTPETVSYLFHKKITNRSISASLLDLINQKIITCEKLSKNNYKLTLNSNKVLNPIQSRLVKVIFLDQNSIETKHMKKNARNNYNKFINNWNTYQRAAINNSKMRNFYEEKSKSKKTYNKSSFQIMKIFIATVIFPPSLILIIIYFSLKAIIKFIKIEDGRSKVILTILLLIMAIISINQCINILIFQKFYNQSFIIYVIDLILSLIAISFIFYKKKRTIVGAEEYKQWKALKNYLNDFGKFSDKEVPDIILWEKYLVYATLFGCAKKIIKAMKVEKVSVPNEYYVTYSDLYVINHYVSNVVRSSYNSAKSAYNIANSSSGSSSSGGSFSSGGGGGGGFSSGGGSFGGGGGGGRF